MTKFFSAVALVAIILLNGPANAAIVVSDNFTYPDGNLAGNGGWNAHSGTGSFVQVASGEVSLAHGGGSREDVNIQFAEITSGVLQYSFDLRVQDDAPVGGSDHEYFAHFAAANTSGGITNFRGRLDVVPASGAGDFSLGIASSSSSADATLTQGFDFGDVVSVAVQYNLDTDIAQLTVNGETVTSAVGSGAQDIVAFAFRQSNSTPDESIFVDNLIVETLSVPEPNSLGVLALVSVAFVIRRRR